MRASVFAFFTVVRDSIVVRDAWYLCKFGICGGKIRSDKCKQRLLKHNLRTMKLYLVYIYANLVKPAKIQNQKIMYRDRNDHLWEQHILLLPTSQTICGFVYLPTTKISSCSVLQVVTWRDKLSERLNIIWQYWHWNHLAYEFNFAMVFENVEMERWILEFPYMTSAIPFGWKSYTFMAISKILSLSGIWDIQTPLSKERPVAC